MHSLQYKKKNPHSSSVQRVNGIIPLDKHSYLLPVNNLCRFPCCTSALEEAEMQFDFWGLCLVDTRRKEVTRGLRDIYL